MTIGIYALIFEGTDKVYIGQSTNIEQRFKKHFVEFSKGLKSKKMQKAFSEFGAPELHGLVECSTQELDINEASMIVEFDSINNGFNTIDGNTPGGSGYTATKSKYTREEILEIFKHLCAGKSRQQITDILGVPVGTVGNILSGTGHLWLKEEFPIEYEKMRNQAANTVYSTNSAKAKGYVYPPIKSPSGEIYTNIENVAEFARKHKLDRAATSGVLRGARPVHKGWSLA